MRRADDRYPTPAKPYLRDIALRPRPSVQSRTITWHPASLEHALAIDIEQLFDEALG